MFCGFDKSIFLKFVIFKVLDIRYISYCPTMNFQN